LVLAGLLILVGCEEEAALIEPQSGRLKALQKNVLQSFNYRFGQSVSYFKRFSGLLTSDF